MRRKPGLPREMTDEGDICLQCEEIIRRLIRPEVISGLYEWTPGPDEFPTSDINIGWISEIAAFRDCALCDFFMRLLGPRAKKHCYIIGSCPRISESGMRKDWNLKMVSHDNDGVGSDQVGFRLCADSAGAVDNGEVLFDLARPVDRLQCSEEFLRAPYQECKRLHGWLCEGPKSILLKNKENSATYLPQAPGMRVIDVQNLCIVRAPSSCRYVALSYVWSTGVQFLLLAENLEELTRPNRLKPELLSKTVSDAIYVTAIVGERYLWVDALCIIQDDDTDKRYQISQMDKIFGGAALTIAAANGTADSDGLPGVRRGSRSPEPLQSVHVRGLHFQSLWPDFDTLMQSSKWHSRGWTFQETLMSKRFLIFTSCQVFYSCEMSCHAEDFVSQVVFDARKVDLQDPRRHKGNCEPNSITSELYSYEIGVNHYTMRDLTFESDGLNAISGIFSAISEELEETFLCGLPVSTLFEHSMLWFPNGRIRRRIADGAHFPSWSWAGWVGEVRYASVKDFGVDGYDYDEDRQIHEWKAVLPDGKELTESELKISEISLRIDYCLLKFNAFSRLFEVKKQSYGGLLMLKTDQDHTACFQIMDGDIWVGSVVMSQELADEVLDHDTNEHEFIVLSNSFHGETLWVPGLTDQVETCNTTDEDGDEMDWPLYDHRRLSPRSGVYNVMMISWEDDVAYRLGVGEIHIDGWNMEESILKQITLG